MTAETFPRTGIFGPTLPPRPTTLKRFGPLFIEAANVRRTQATHSIRAFPPWTIQGPAFSGTISQSTTLPTASMEKCLTPFGAKMKKQRRQEKAHHRRFAAACLSAEIKPGEPLPATLSNPNGGPSPWPWSIPRLKGVRSTKKAQQDHIDPL